jgi:hypothetical protein
MRRRLWTPVLACAACAVVLAYGVRAAGPLSDPDEAAWIFSSYSFRLAFLTPGGLRSAEWKGPDALDHPPLAKFLFGAALAPAGLLPVSATDKDRWFDRAFLPYDHAAFVAALNEKVSARALRRARAVAAAAMLLACALTALAGTWLISPEAGALAALLLVLAGVTRSVAAEAVSDGPFVALELAGALAQAAWAARMARDRRFSPAWSLLCGALAGALFDVKISGILAFPLLAASAAAALASAPRSRPLRGAVVRSVAAAVAAGALVAVALDPSLYREPLAFAFAMFRQRASTLAIQRLVYFGGAFRNPIYALCGVLRGLFSPEDGAWVGAATAVLACAALPGARRRWAAASTGARAFVLSGAVWTLATCAVYRVDWPRYLLPALPFVALLAAAGAARFAALPASRRPRAAAAAALAAALVIVPARLFTPLHYWFVHPDEYQRALDAQIPYLLDRYPGDRALILRGEAQSRLLLERLSGAP